MRLKTIMKRAIYGGAAFAAFANAALAETELKVRFGGSPHWFSAYESVAKQFEAANPGVKVKLSHTPHGSYNDMVASLAMANDLPDVMQIDSPYLANYAWSGLIQPVEKYIDP